MMLKSILEKKTGDQIIGRQCECGVGQGLTNLSWKLGANTFSPVRSA